MNANLAVLQIPTSPPAPSNAATAGPPNDSEKPKTQGFAATPVKVLASDATSATVTGALTAQSAVASTGTIAIKGAWLGHGGGE